MCEGWCVTYVFDERFLGWRKDKIQLLCIFVNCMERLWILTETQIFTHDTQDSLLSSRPLFFFSFRILTIHNLSRLSFTLECYAFVTTVVTVESSERADNRVFSISSFIFSLTGHSFAVNISTWKIQIRTRALDLAFALLDYLNNKENTSRRQNIMMMMTVYSTRASSKTELFTTE